MYTTMASDVESGVEGRRVVLVEKRSSAGWMWKVSGALLAVALCVGAISFVWYFNGRPEVKEHSGQAEARSTSEITEPHGTLSQISSGAKAAIHLEGKYEDDVADAIATLQWRKDQGQAFDQGGFQLRNNRVVIPQSGLYFVYSQASFRVSCGEEGVGGSGGRGLMPTLSHRIWRYSDSMGRDASLMNAVRSACQSPTRDGQGWYNAIYLGAVFQLKKGDELWTETNHLSALETDEGKTFFGVFAL